MTRTGIRRAIITRHLLVGCVFELLARWNVANQGYANGQVLGAPEGVDIGQLTVVEVDGTLAVVGNECAFTAQGTPVWGDLGLYSQAIARTLGKAHFITDLNLDNDVTKASFYSWQDGANVGLNDRVFTMTFTTSARIFAVVGDGAGVFSTSVVVGAYVALTDYDIAIVLGGYDVNGVPWDDSQAAASYLYGCAMFIRGGAFANWTLLWRDVNTSIATLYAASSNLSHTGTMDDMRVSGYDYSAVLQPTVKDTFTDANGTSLDAHTPDVAPAVWIEQAGNWDIQANRASVILNAAIGVATLDSGISDMFIRGTGNVGAGGNDISIVYRYSDLNNYWFINASATANQFRIIERNGGVNTVRAVVGIAIGVAIDYEMTGTMNGQDMTAYLDGANRLAFASVFQQNATIHGLRGFDAAGGATFTFDNFHFQPRDGYAELDECP